MSDLTKDLSSAYEFCKSMIGSEPERGSAAALCILAAAEIERLTSERDAAREAAMWFYRGGRSIFDDGSWVETRWPWLEEQS